MIAKNDRWVLLSEKGYAAMDSKGKCIVVESLKDALVFDFRDNEEMKRKYYSAILKTSFIVEILPK